jgi:beta-galactosidase
MAPRPTLVPGVRTLLHGGDYNPDQWQAYPEVLEQDERLLELSGMNLLSIGIFSWTSYEREEGKFDFGWLDRTMDMLARIGARVSLATPSAAKPAWLAQRYPEVRRVNRRGLREEQGYRHNHCWSSPVYREKIALINRKLAERFGGHPALGVWHVGNEYSGQCYCERCIAWFQSWLEQKYGALDALNQAWWTAFWSHSFTSFSQIDPRDSSIDGLVVDYRAFFNHQVADFLRWEMAPLRELAPGVPCTTNFMGLHPELHYASLAEHVDFVADDQYPGYSAEDAELPRKAAAVGFKDDLYRCFKPERPWMLMESCPEATQWQQPMRLKRPGLHQLEMLQALAHGAEGTCYFQWRKGRGGSEKMHGAVVDHVGSEQTRVFRTVADLGEKYRKLAPIVGSIRRARVALIYDWDVRWCFEASSGPPNRNDAYVSVAVDHYRAFWERGVAVDVLASDRDFSEYDLLVTPQLWMLKPGVAERIRRFVQGGGVWVATHLTGYVQQSNLMLLGGLPGDGLKEVLGIWNEEFDSLPTGKLRRLHPVAGTSELPLECTGRDICELLHLRGARALAEYAEDFYSGMAAVTANTFGKGHAYYLGTKLDAASLDHFYGTLLQHAGIAGALGGSHKLPGGVTVQRRSSAETEFLFVLSFTPEEVRLTLLGGRYRDLLDDRELEGELRLGAWGSTVLARIG